MKTISKRLERLDDLFEKLENEVKLIDEQNHFANRSDVFVAVSKIGVDIEAAKKIVLQNLGD